MPKAKYNSRKCLSPFCPNKQFIPQRSDQKVCDNICRSRYHSHLKREASLLIYKQEIEIKKADKVLKMLHDNCNKNKIDSVEAKLLKLLNVPLNSAIEITEDPGTKWRIFWFYEYGIMGVARDKFKILKKWKK